MELEDLATPTERHEMKEKAKRKVKPHYPRPTKALDITTFGPGKTPQVLERNKKWNPLCIFEELDEKKPCKWRTSRGRCRKRLLWGRKVRLTKEGRCPGFHLKIIRKDRMKANEEAL